MSGYLGHLKRLLALNEIEELGGLIGDNLAFGVGRHQREARKAAKSSSAW